MCVPRNEVGSCVSQACLCRVSWYHWVSVALSALRHSLFSVRCCGSLLPQCLSLCIGMSQGRVGIGPRKVAPEPAHIASHARNSAAAHPALRWTNRMAWRRAPHGNASAWQANAWQRRHYGICPRDRANEAPLCTLRLRARCFHPFHAHDLRVLGNCVTPLLLLWTKLRCSTLLWPRAPDGTHREGKQATHTWYVRWCRARSEARLWCRWITPRLSLVSALRRPLAPTLLRFDEMLSSSRPAACLRMHAHPIRTYARTARMRHAQSLNNPRNMREEANAVRRNPHDPHRGHKRSGT